MYQGKLGTCSYFKFLSYDYCVNRNHNLNRKMATSQHGSCELRII